MAPKKMPMKSCNTFANFPLPFQPRGRQDPNIEKKKRRKIQNASVFCEQSKAIDCIILSLTTCSARASFQKEVPKLVIFDRICREIMVRKLTIALLPDPPRPVVMASLLGFSWFFSKYCASAAKSDTPTSPTDQLPRNTPMSA